MKQNQGYGDQTVGCQGGGSWGKDGLGVWDQLLQTIIYRMDKQQGPTVWPRELYQYPMISHNGKEYEKECMYN